jgi:cytochrome b561
MLVAMLMFLIATVVALPAIESRLGILAHLGQVILYVLALVFLIRGLLGAAKDRKKPQ